MANPLFVSLLRLKNLSMRLLLGEDRREAHSPEAQRKIIESFQSRETRSNAHTFSMYARTRDTHL